MTNPEDRRKYKRVLFTVEDGIVGVFNPPGDSESAVHGKVINLSEGGVLLTFRTILNNKIKEGDRLVLTEIKGKSSSQVIINVDTEVKWISEDTLSQEIGVGLEFLNIQEDNKHELSSFVDYWYLERLRK